MSYLIIPYTKSQIFPENLFIYLNDVADIVLENNLTPGIYDIAAYISSFKVVIFKEMTNAQLYRQREVIQIAKTFNPDLLVYIRYDAGIVIDQDSTQVLGTPYDQIRNSINNIVLNYNPNREKTIDGIWIENYDFPTVDFGVDPSGDPTKSGLTFRDCQLYAKSILNQYNLLMAFTCLDYKKVTNLDFILKYTWSTVQNPKIFFDDTSLLINTKLYASGIYVSGSFSSGYTPQPEFMYNMLLLNSIRMDRGNLGLKICLCLTAKDVPSYNSATFFFSESVIGSKAVGVAQAFYRLATWISADYVCTSPYEDFYLSETSTSPLYCRTLPFDKTYGDFNDLNRLEAVGNGTIGYEINPTVSISVPGQDTFSLVFDNSAYPIIVP